MTVIRRLVEIRSLIENSNVGESPTWDDIRPIVRQIYSLTELPITEGVCPTCGASTKQHKHSLSRGLVEGLTSLYDFGGGPVNLKELRLTRNQWDNFQKLKYWGFVESVTIEGKSKKGVWRLTDLGASFIEGVEMVRKSVITYRGEVVEFYGDTVGIHDVYSPGYRQREDYARDSRPM